MSTPEQEENELSAQRAADMRVLREIRGIAAEDSQEEAAQAKLFRILRRYGWIVLLPAIWLLTRHFM